MTYDATVVHSRGPRLTLTAAPPTRMAAIIWTLATVLLLTQANLGIVNSVSDIGGKGEWLLAKPALVPYIDTTGTLLVHVPNSVPQTRLVEIRDNSNSCLQRLPISDVSEVHTDIHGRTWLHVPLDLSPLPQGASVVHVGVWADGRVWGGASVKVVRAKPKSGGVVVDNVRGRLVGSEGLPLFPFGAYTYGVVTEVERGVAEEEVQYGQ